MNHLKVVETSRTGYNTQSVIKTPVTMEIKPVNPERAIDQKLVEKAQRATNVHLVFWLKNTTKN